MNRRDTVLALFALAAGRPLVGSAHPLARLWRIGYLGPPADVTPHLLKAFQDGLRDLGYVEGRNIIVEYRWTTGRGREPADPVALLAFAKDLVAAKVDVIAVSIDPAAFAAKKAAGNVPIVMMNVS